MILKISVVYHSFILFVKFSASSLAAAELDR